MMIGYYNYTVILTYVGLVCSALGITQAAEGNTINAVVCLVIAGICDLFDGRIARTKKRTKDEKTFGIQIDSLCDLVGFGVLPAAIGHSITGSNPLANIVYAFFILAGVIRLAYYNVSEQKRQEIEVGDREYFQGLPITTSSIIIPLLFLRQSHIKHFEIVLPVVMLFTAIAFISNFKVRKHIITDMREVISDKLHR